MRILTGLLLLGCSAVAVIAWLPEDTLPIQLSVMTTEGKSGYAQISPAAAETVGAVRSFASAKPLSPQAQGQDGSVADDARVPAVKRVVPPSAATVQPTGPIAQAPSVDMSTSSGGGSASRAAPALTPPSAGSQRAELIRNLQRELKRVGCYQGELTGEWSAATKKAMIAFNERLNATLPVEDPDYILLTLVQGQSSRTCGQSCPTGQSMTGDGRCMPNAVLAQPKAKQLEHEPKSAHREAAAHAQPVPGLVAQPAPAQRSKWSDPIVSVPAPRPAVQGQPVLAMPQPPMPIGPAAQPLPGRMAVGRGQMEEAQGLPPAMNGVYTPAGAAVANPDDQAAVAPPLPVNRPPAVRAERRGPDRPVAQRSEPAKTWAKHIFNN